LKIERIFSSLQRFRVPPAACLLRHVTPARRVHAVQRLQLGRTLLLTFARRVPAAAAPPVFASVQCCTRRWRLGRALDTRLTRDDERRSGARPRGSALLSRAVLGARRPRACDGRLFVCGVVRCACGVYVWKRTCNRLLFALVIKI